jgi:hypothetical protein
MKKIIGAGLVLLLVAGACTSLKITSSWRAENIQAKQYNKILVLGLINEPDRTIREKMEQHLVGHLREIGYTAVCSCEEFDPKAFENLSENQALEKLNKSGIDAVLTIVLLDKQKERYYVPGRVYYSPYIIYHNRFWGYYTTMYHRVYAEGYYSVDTKYFWESNFYSLGDDKALLYSAQSQSFDPSSAESLGHQYGQMIVKDMVKHNVLSGQMVKRPS